MVIPTRTGGVTETGARTGAASASRAAAAAAAGQPSPPSSPSPSTSPSFPPSPPSPSLPSPSPPSPSSTFVVVGGSPAGAADAPDPDKVVPASGDELLQQRALAAVEGCGRPLAASVFGAALVLTVSEWLFGDSFSAGGAIAALIAAAIAALVGDSLAAAMRRKRSIRDRPTHRPPERRRRSSSAHLALPLLLVATAPWLAPAAGWTGESTLLAGLMVAVALLGAWLLAPLRTLAGGAAALPLSPALHFGLLPAGAEATGYGPATACFLASAALLLLAAAEHRRWRHVTGATIDLENRLAGMAAARDAATRADQDKSRFLAIASHDLRQPVHAIGLFAATLEKRLAGSAEEPLVRNLNRAIDGLDRSFNVMLDISRLDAGAVEPRVQQFPLRDLFRRLHMHFAGQAEQKGLGLRFSPGGKSVSSDPQLLERVLGNLVQNAIKYTERGGIVVVARSTPTHTHVEVWDTGIGIRPVDLPKVFDEFYQVGRGERVRAQGLGMGLAIVKRLVRLMGHRLTVASRPGRGTMFRLAIALGGLPDIQDVTAAADTVPMPVLQARTVLVLDDEEPIREGLCLLLQEWGYEAVAAGSIAEAEAAVDQLELPPDLMLSDLHLGEGSHGRDGIAAIEAIRQRCGTDIAAMLITGDTSHAEIRRATDSGHPVLFKPVQPRKLYDALRGLGS